MSVPTIDLSRGPGEVADEVRLACEDVGFLTVVGHEVDARLIEAVAARSRAFFDLPDAEKERFRVPAATPGLPVYRPLGAEKLGANADRKASLDWGPSLEGVGWPSPELRDAYERYYAEMLRVGCWFARSPSRSAWTSTTSIRFSTIARQACASSTTPPEQATREQARTATTGA